ncbi:signal peptide peptidase SppA [bacterium]|nr:signal peptide peptidase SppA [bacterium]
MKIMTLLMVSFIFAILGFAYAFEPTTSPATGDDPWAALSNPAYLGKPHQGDLLYFSSLDNGSYNNEWGILGTFSGLGGGYYRVQSTDNWYVGLGAGFARRFYLGSNYLWQENEDGLRSEGWSFGVLAQPIKQVSFGWKYQATDWLKSNHFGLGLRPLGWRATFFWEGVLPENADFKDISNYFGAELHLINGFRIYGKMDEDKNFWAGLRFDLQNIGIGGVVAGNENEVIRETYYGHISTEYFKTVIPDRRKLLTLNLSGQLKERSSAFSIFQMNDGLNLVDLVNYLEQARENKYVEGLVLRIDNFSANIAMAEELRNALLAFKESGKSIDVYVDSPGNLQYYLASVGDRIVLPEAGSVNLTGLMAEMTFYKGTFEKIGLDADFERAGKYKSAVEPFTLDSMSAENREEMEKLLDDIYDDFVDKIAAGRNWSAEATREIIDNGPYTPSEAVEKGLVDSLMYWDDFRKSATEDKTAMSWSEYTGRNPREYNWGPIPKVAIVYAQGNITRGSSRSPLLGGLTLGSDTFRKAIEAAKNDWDVKAILVRVDSPGGSAQASDEMWHAIRQAAEKKPVIISMGSSAASGGYYIAAAGDYIFADNNTITGSIGVISGKISLGGLYDKVGINKQYLRRGQNSGIWTSSKEFSELERERIQTSIMSFYDLFKNRVLTTRELTMDSLEAVAQGRVWTGTAAKKIGLVDSLGGIHEAIQYTKLKGGLKIDSEFHLKMLPSWLNMFPFMGALVNKLRISYPFKDELDKLPVFPYEDNEALYLWPYKLYLY